MDHLPSPYSKFQWILIKSSIRNILIFGPWMMNKLVKIPLFDKISTLKMKTQNNKNYLNNTELTVVNWVLITHVLNKILTPKMKTLKKMRYLNYKAQIIFHLYVRLTSRLKELLHYLHKTESLLMHTIKAFIN